MGSNSMFDDDAWAPPPPPVGEDKLWREVELEKEWSEKAKDMSVPSLSGMRKPSFGAISPSLLQRQDSTFEKRVDPWGRSYVLGGRPGYRRNTSESTTGDLFGTNAPPADMNEQLAGFEQEPFEDSDEEGEANLELEGGLHEEPFSDDSDSAHPPQENGRDRSISPRRLTKRRSSILSIRSLPRVMHHENNDSDNEQQLDSYPFPQNNNYARQQGSPTPSLVKKRSSQMQLRRKASAASDMLVNSTHSSSSTLVESRSNGASSMKVLADVVSGGEESELDEELSTDNSITFYQGFRALHPKMASTASLNSPHKLGLNLGNSSQVSIITSFQPPTPRGGKELPTKARLHAASINNIARLFSELLNERDTVLAESDKLENTRVALSDELRQVEDLLTDLGRRKQDLTAKLKRVVAKEEKVNVLLDELDSKIGSIGDESQSFERTIRKLKGHSAAITADIDVDEDDVPEIPPNTCFRTLYGHTDSVECLDFDMPFGTLVTGSADKTIRVWDLSSHRCAASLSGHTGWVRALQLKGQTLMTGSGDHTIRQWNLSNLPPLPSTNPAHPSNIPPSTPYYTPVANEDISVHTYKGHTGGVGCLMFDDSWLVSGSADKTIRQWDRETGAEVAVLRSERWVDQDGMDRADRLLLGEFPPPATSVVAPPTDLIRTNTSSVLPPRAGFTLYNVGGHVGALQFWRHALAAGYGDGVIRLWDLRTGKCHRELHGHTGAVTTLKFDQSNVVSGSVDRTVKVWDLRGGEAIDDIRFQGGVIDLHHDMFRLTVAAGSSNVKIYNRTTSAIKILEGHTKPVRALRHMDDTLISGGMDTTVRLWRI
ncbi:WD40-repeat-containing domain protein [Fimicolochytrium jonesii]|uniref:WD40-repeat-containing domain protein n=1 Tax=Fimicolochytrium jonesii TaxID=1396493 RepID=UPI0022FEAF2C|nr:WD40-repeat-containing domain protein [Fimicolochytrium jonesii]KAI8816995.1 WD40-repeat-containing domain protein [Fimicolochytrium jonesii]